MKREFHADNPVLFPSECISQSTGEADARDTGLADSVLVGRIGMERKVSGYGGVDAKSALDRRAVPAEPEGISKEYSARATDVAATESEIAIPAAIDFLARCGRKGFAVADAAYAAWGAGKAKLKLQLPRIREMVLIGYSQVFRENDYLENCCFLCPCALMAPVSSRGTK